MPPQCPICKETFEEAKLAEHVEREHKASTEPEIEAMREHAHHQCPKCGKDHASPEGLSEHLLNAHRM